MRRRTVRRSFTLARAALARAALTGAALTLTACIDNPAVGHEGEMDAAPTALEAGRVFEADARAPNNVAVPHDAAVMPGDRPSSPLVDARAVPPDAIGPDAFEPPDAGSPAPDGGLGPAPDCRALIDRAGEPCEAESFPNCTVPFGAGCCAHEVYCDAGLIADGIFCEDDCDQACHANPDAANCALQPGCTWFVGGCDPPPEGFVTGPACIGTPGAACGDAADCPLGTECLSYWIDPCAGADCDACGAETRQCGTDAVPAGVSPCEDALRHVMGCFANPVPPVARGVAWPACGPADRCAAECALALDCRELACNFDGDIDCDGIGAWGVCVQENCDAAGCAEDCGLTSPAWDCCSEQFSCEGGCEMGCVIPEPPEPLVCRCVDDVCRAVVAP